jgi:hypothetical protein
MASSPSERTAFTTPTLQSLKVKYSYISNRAQFLAAVHLSKNYSLISQINQTTSPSPQLIFLFSTNTGTRRNYQCHIHNRRINSSINMDTCRNPLLPTHSIAASSHGSLCHCRLQRSCCLGLLTGHAFSHPSAAMVLKSTSTRPCWQRACIHCLYAPPTTQQRGCRRQQRWKKRFLNNSNSRC